MRGLFLELLILKQSSHYIQQQWQTVLCMGEVDEHLLVVVAKYILLVYMPFICSIGVGAGPADPVLARQLFRQIRYRYI